jgi:hypothetical protein
MGVPLSNPLLLGYLWAFGYIVLGVLEGREPVSAEVEAHGSLRGGRRRARALPSELSRIHLPRRWLNRGRRTRDG